jgi:hypothetical protein
MREEGFGSSESEEELFSWAVGRTCRLDISIRQLKMG